MMAPAPSRRLDKILQCQNQARPIIKFWCTISRQAEIQEDAKNHTFWLEDPWGGYRRCQRVRFLFVSRWSILPPWIMYHHPTLGLSGSSGLCMNLPASESQMPLPSANLGWPPAQCPSITCWGVHGQPCDQSIRESHKIAADFWALSRWQSSVLLSILFICQNPAVPRHIRFSSIGPWA